MSRKFLWKAEDAISQFAHALAMGAPLPEFDRQLENALRQVNPADAELGAIVLDLMDMYFYVYDFNVEGNREAFEMFREGRVQGISKDLAVYGEIDRVSNIGLYITHKQ